MLRHNQFSKFKFRCPAINLSERTHIMGENQPICHLSINAYPLILSEVMPGLKRAYKNAVLYFILPISKA